MSNLFACDMAANLKTRTVYNDVTQQVHEGLLTNDSIQQSLLRCKQHALHVQPAECVHHNRTDGHVYHQFIVPAIAYIAFQPAWTELHVDSGVSSRLQCVVTSTSHQSLNGTADIME